MIREKARWCCGPATLGGESPVGAAGSTLLDGVSRKRQGQTAFSPLEDDLRRVAPHVQYEIDSYVWAWKTFQELADSEIIRRRLVLEALLLHFRNLLNFFRPRRQGPLDVLARHFVPNGSELDSGTARLEVYRARLNSLLSHLSYERTRCVREGEMGWDIDQMTTHLADAWGLFLRLLPLDRREWFRSEHGHEIELVVSPMVTVTNPMSGAFTTNVMETTVLAGAELFDTFRVERERG